MRDTCQEVGVFWRCAVKPIVGSRGTRKNVRVFLEQTRIQGSFRKGG